jgi:hypothetical protein
MATSLSCNCYLAAGKQTLLKNCAAAGNVDDARLGLGKLVMTLNCQRIREAGEISCSSFDSTPAATGCGEYAGRPAAATQTASRGSRCADGIDRGEMNVQGRAPVNKSAAGVTAAAIRG